MPGPISPESECTPKSESCFPTTPYPDRGRRKSGMPARPSVFRSFGSVPQTAVNGVSRQECCRIEIPGAMPTYGDLCGWRSSFVRVGDHPLGARTTLPPTPFRASVIRRSHAQASVTTLRPPQTGPIALPTFANTANRDQPRTVVEYGDDGHQFSVGRGLFLSRRSLSCNRRALALWT